MFDSTSAHSVPGPSSHRTFQTLDLAKAWLARVRAWAQNTREALIDDSVPAPGNGHQRWMLFQSEGLHIDNRTGTVTCRLCRKCMDCLSRVSEKTKEPELSMPATARANGLWRGPDPPELASLSYSEAKVINLARVYVSVKRVFLDKQSYARTRDLETPLYHQNNVVAYPQNPDAALTALGLSPQSLAQTLVVQYVGEDRAALRGHKDLSVSVDKLRIAFRWLSLNTWPFMDATKHHDIWQTGFLDPSLEHLLQAYTKSVGSTVGGAPAEIIQGAMRISPERASVSAAGPKDCVDDENEADVESFDHAPVMSGGVVDGGVDNISPLQLWDTIMKKYKLAQICDQQIKQLDAVKDGSRTAKDASEKDHLLRERMVAVATAVESLSKLHHKESQAKLREFLESGGRVDTPVSIAYGSDFLSNKNPLFWFSCFVRLFPRGDCMEKCPERLTVLAAWRWAKCLLTRADVRIWAQDVEFVATLYNLLLRREQVHAVEANVKSSELTKGNMNDIAKLTATGLVSYALSSGDANSVRDLLRRKNLEVPLEKTFRAMQITQRSVRGSEAEKDNLLPRFAAMRLWSGCSSLFFTLNPHDIRSPITLLLVQGDVSFEQKFSMSFEDAAADQFITEFTRGNPRIVHELVARNPMAATRCFHWTVRLVIRVLFNCADKPGQNLDNIAASDTPGVFGYVRGYLGIVEPQMRKALHTHMLVQLLGFAHPDDILGNGILKNVFRRLWYYIASVQFRSTEAFAHYLNVPEAMKALREEPLLHLTTKQRGMIGEERVREAQKAQLQARDLEAPRDIAGRAAQVSFFTSSMHTAKNLDAASWSRKVVAEVAAHTRKTGNHVCRPDVCNKGRIGKRGFCRMYFWHWARSLDAKGVPIAKMTHGVQLCPRWDGIGSPPITTAPPFTGTPSLEVTHPFHFKMTPSMLLGPKCNHDLGILLRLVDASAPSTDIEQVRGSLLDAIGDHEFYCASYSSKEQPHMEGLLTTLIDGMKSKEVAHCVLERNLKLTCLMYDPATFLQLQCAILHLSVGMGFLLIANLQVFKGCNERDDVHFSHATCVRLEVNVFFVCTDLLQHFCLLGFSCAERNVIEP